MFHAKNKDLKFGKKNENNTIDIFNKFFGGTFNKTVDKWDPFDFLNKEECIYIELKTRRNTKNKYPTTMVGYNKIIDGLKHIENGFSVYFCFKFTDGLYYYKLPLDGGLNDKCVKDIGGRCDRGRAEYKDYFYINLLSPLI